MTLHSVVGQRTKSGGQIYCGPTAVMAITGRPYTEVQPAMNRVRMRKETAAIMGVAAADVLATLYQFGYWASLVPSTDDYPYRGKTIAKVLRERTPEQVNQTWIIQTRDHFAVVKGRKFIDNHTKKPVWIRNAPHRRARVKQIYQLISKQGLTSCS